LPLSQESEKDETGCWERIESLGEREGTTKDQSKRNAHVKSKRGDILQAGNSKTRWFLKDRGEIRGKKVQGENKKSQLAKVQNKKNK